MNDVIHTVGQVLQLLSALAVILLVLLQHGKGADMGAAFGSGASGSLFGATGSANFLSRMTAVAAAVFFISTLLLAFVSVDKPRGQGSVMDGAVPATTAPAVPGGGGAVPVPSGSTVPAAGTSTNPVPSVPAPSSIPVPSAGVPPAPSAPAPAAQTPPVPTPAAPAAGAPAVSTPAPAGSSAPGQGATAVPETSVSAPPAPPGTSSEPAQSPQGGTN